ncbi:lysophospholipid acyltransferase family protein [Pseudogemmobacter sonorensis]|uniref:lysophospholipid acyltransferase family protein n=1 Tax=Pseudogemmobacter sonorensis TaxID=2989681 RepID=UPI00367B5E68
MTDWTASRPEPFRPGLLGWLRAGLRGLALVVLVYGAFLCLLAVRLVEWPLFRRDRPWSPKITRLTCRAALAVIGLGYALRGRPMVEKGALVANHSSWLDILALNAGQEVYFVSKSEVARWPGIGLLARATGTVFIARKGVEAKRQQGVFEDRLRAGHRLCFFPEGTSTDSIRVLPFKSTLFQAFFTHGLDRVLHLQPVTVVYHAPAGEDPRFYGWWANMTFFSHLLRMLAAPRHGRVEVICHPPVPVDAFESRKALAHYCEQVVRTAHVNAVM